MLRQQPLDLTAQRRVSLAGVVEESRPPVSESLCCSASMKMSRSRMTDVLAHVDCASLHYSSATTSARIAQRNSKFSIAWLAD